MTTTPHPVTPQQLRDKYAGPNPYAGPDPQGDATVELPGGQLSTPATRAVARARLAEAWEQGREAYASSAPYG